MRFVIDINGYYEWVPVPANTEITLEDKERGLVKEMSNGNWFMRQSLRSRAEQHHDVGIPDEAIDIRIAALRAQGKDDSRWQVVADLLRESFRSHLHPSHIVKIHVHDDPVMEKFLNSFFVPDTKPAPAAKETK